MSDLAPIILFVYNRPEHTLKTLKALKACNLADESELYIYADGPKENADILTLEQINKTRKVIRSDRWCKKVVVKESETNKGLASSIIHATSEIVNAYGWVITIEDDVLVTKSFLQFMNEGLRRFRNHPKVFMISGYFLAVHKIEANHESFFLPLATSQAWGTWKRAWDQFDTKATGYEKLKTSDSLRKKFDLDDSYEFTKMLITQMESQKIDSWAIRFYWSMFKNNGVNLFPDRSLIKNIGWDNTGTHCVDDNPWEDNFDNSDYFISKYPTEVITDKPKFTKTKAYYKSILKPKKVSIVHRIKNKVWVNTPPPIRHNIAYFINPRYRDEYIQEKKLKNFPRFTPTTVQFDGKRLEVADVNSYRFMKKEIFLNKIYNFSSKDKQPFILDCGANIGLSVIYLKQLFPESRIIAFEPDDKIFSILKKNVESFNLKDVDLVKKACWKEETILEFYSEGADGGRALNAGEKENMIKVETVRLGTYLNQKVDFLKIDIEGAEWEVLQDIKDDLKNVKNIFVEYHSFVNQPQMLPEIISILKDAGFRLHVTSPGLSSTMPFTKLHSYADMDNQLNIFGIRFPSY